MPEDEPFIMQPGDFALASTIESLELPDDNSIDEERRLCYVGVTRAQEQLTLSFALTRRKWGKPRETVPSRFLYEMTGQAENAAKARTAASNRPHQKQKSPTRKR